MAKTQHGRDLTGTEMARMLDEFANGATPGDFTAFAEQVTVGVHRTIQQKIMGLFVKTIEKWAADKRSGSFDLRNEATVRLADKFVQATGDEYERYLPLI